MTTIATTHVFPARAGMIRPAVWRGWCRPGIPRESGDDPAVVNLHRELAEYSPRERG